MVGELRHFAASSGPSGPCPRTLKWRPAWVCQNTPEAALASMGFSRLPVDLFNDLAL